ncbi:MAG: hypothetical protein DRI84_08210, partial [Bacteroidetes bacterium]
DELNIDQLKFNDAVLQKIFDEYVQAIETEAKPSEKFFVNHPEEDVRMMAINLMSEAYELSKRWEEQHKINVTLENAPKVVARATVSSVYSLKIKKVDSMKAKIKEIFSNQNPQGDDLEIYMRRWKELDEAQNQMNRALGRIIV